MKMKSLKKLGLVLGMTLMAVSCAKSKSNVITGKLSGFSSDADVTLISRYTGGTYTTATYSFRHMSQDVNVTRNNMEILFEGREDFAADFFETNTVVDDHSFIYDLGKRSCASIQSSVPGDRKSRPLVWLAYSDADPSNLAHANRASVNVGHCYLAYNNDEDGRVVTLFNVKAHVKSKSVTINEIEVLNVLSSK